MTHLKQIIPEIFVDDGLRAVDFYQRAFGFEERSRTMTRDGKKLMHAELVRDGQRLFVCDEFPPEHGGTCKSPSTLKGTGVRIMLEVDDADGFVQRAAAAGAKVIIEVQEFFWGARYGKLMDPFGHEWGVNQQLEVLSEEEQKRRAQAFFAKQS